MINGSKYIIYVKIARVDRIPLNYGSLSHYLDVRVALLVELVD